MSTERIDVDELKAGSELDSLIAIEVLGWKYEPRFSNDVDGYYWDNDGERYISEELPSFSTDIAAAWWVVEHLHKTGDIDPFIVELGDQYLDPNVGYWDYHLRELRAFLTDKNMPLHVCLAALKAVQK